MGLPGSTLIAVAARDVAFRGNEIADVRLFHLRTDLRDGAGEFVTERDGWSDPLSAPVVPFVDVKVGSADAGGFDFDEYLVGARLGDGK